MENLQYSLFNAGDDWIAHFIDDVTFEESLLLNILFQERVLMHESYFFNSTLLARHMQRARGNLSLLEYGARRGFIVPAVRDHQVETLGQAYESLVSGSLYPDYELIPPEMKLLVPRLISAVDQGLHAKNQKPFYWPEPDSDELSLGTQYLNLIRDVFQREDPPNFESLSPNRRSLFDRVWAQTTDLRFDAIEEAASRTQSNGNLGVQRIELMRTLGWRLGIPRSELTFNAPDITTRITEPELRLTAEIFTKWLAQIHHLTQARLFGTSINFPVYDLDNDFLLDSIFRSTADGTAIEPSRDDLLKCEVKLPPLQALIELGAEEVMAIRDFLGEGYIEHLKIWQKDPTNDNREKVSEALRDYCDRICMRYEDDHLERLIATFMLRKNADFVDLAKKATVAGSTVAGSIPGAGLFVSVANLVYATYQYVGRRRLHARLGPKEQIIDVDLTIPEVI